MPCPMTLRPIQCDNNLFFIAGQLPEPARWHPKEASDLQAACRIDGLPALTFQCC